MSSKRGTQCQTAKLPGGSVKACAKTLASGASLTGEEAGMLDNMFLQGFLQEFGFFLGTCWISWFSL